VLLAVVFASPLYADTRIVRHGESLQSALNSAQAGDVILLEAGAEFVGNFVLPVKSGNVPIVVRSTSSALLPHAGVRIKPEHQPLLARVRSPNTAAALRTAAGAHHWEVRYLEFGANQNGYGDIIQIGDGSSAQNTLDKVPHDLVLSHLYVHGDARLGQKRCIALNGAGVTIRDSHVSDCKGVGIDTQAIGGWNGPGPFLIENNYLEATGENVLFATASPSGTTTWPVRSRGAIRSSGRRHGRRRRRRRGAPCRLVSTRIASSRGVRSARAPSGARPPRSKPPRRW
jgi:hypothetical protein